MSWLVTIDPKSNAAKRTKGKDSQYLNVDTFGANGVTPLSGPGGDFDLKFYEVKETKSPVAYLENKDLGEVRLDKFKQVTLTKRDDTLSINDIRYSGGLKIDFGAGLDTIDFSHAPFQTHDFWVQVDLQGGLTLVP